jgi:hypothetical protein
MTVPRNPAEIEAKLRQRAATDSGFRAAFLADPRATIERELGVTIPAGITIKAVEDTADTMYVVVPQATSGDLSDAALEGVSGGTYIDHPSGGGGW